MVIVGAGAVASGFYQYNDSQWGPLSILHLAFFTLAFVALEIIHRKRLARERPFTAPIQVTDNLGNLDTITHEEFKRRIGSGKELVVLDDLVLDVTTYLNDHPGGRFSIENNIGRDVSKFFYGGYTQENESKMWPYTHSSIARGVVERLIIGRLIDEADVRMMKVGSVEQDAN